MFVKAKMRNVQDVGNLIENQSKLFAPDAQIYWIKSLFIENIIYKVFLLKIKVYIFKNKMSLFNL